MRIRIEELTRALNSRSGCNPDHEAQVKVVEVAGGTSAAWTELRGLQKKFPDLQKHVTWFDGQRAYAKSREGKCESEAMLQFDYGGLTDSAGSKVSVWTVAVVVKNREQEHFDFFFDAANQHQARDDDGSAKKNGKTGIYLLSQLFCKTQAPAGCQGKSLFGYYYPKVTHLLHSGDTGNGFRAYEMLDELSCFKSKYDYSTELIPLCPKHAYNRSDSRIAHMNTFLEKVKSKGRLLGAKEVAEAFHCATDPNRTTKRTFMARCHVFFRAIKKVQTDKGNLGALLKSPYVTNQSVGVRGLLYFDFSFLDKQGRKVYLEGYARVREYGDEAKSGNRTFVYTWRKDREKQMCQACSDREQFPVLLSASHYGQIKLRMQIKLPNEKFAGGQKGTKGGPAFHVC